MYHNKRDKYGRFASNSDAKAKKSAPKKEHKKVEEPKVTKKIILNAFLLDDSSSMQPKAYATIEGFNSILASGRKDSEITGVDNREVLIKFGHLGGYSVQRAPDVLSNSNYWPRQGQTALWDAILRGIEDMERMAVTLNNCNVIFTIFTDGENNVNYHLEGSVHKVIKHKQDQGWVINFIGAGNEQHVRRMSDSVGIFASNTLSYEDNSRGVSGAMGSFVKSKTAYTQAVVNNTATMDGFFSQD